MPNLANDENENITNAANTTLIDRLDTADREFQEKLARLQRFKKKSKAAVKATSVKVEWCKEHSKLAKAAVCTEEDCSSLLEVLLLHSAGLDESETEAGTETEVGAEKKQQTETPASAQSTDPLPSVPSIGYDIMQMEQAFLQGRQRSTHHLTAQLGEIKELWALTRALAPTTLRSNATVAGSASSSSADVCDVGIVPTHRLHERLRVELTNYHRPIYST